jgi:hypothetical protein
MKTLTTRTKPHQNLGLESFAANSSMLGYNKGIEGWKRASNTQN